MFNIEIQDYIALIWLRLNKRVVDKKCCKAINYAKIQLVDFISNILRKNDGS